MRSIKSTKNKGMMNLLVEVVLLIAVVVLVAVLVFQVTDDTRTTMGEDYIKAGGTKTATCNLTTGIYEGCGTVGINATIDADSAIGKIPKNLKILATAVVFAVIIYVIMRVIPMARPGSSF